MKKQVLFITLFFFIFQNLVAGNAQLRVKIYTGTNISSFSFTLSGKGFNKMFCDSTACYSLSGKTFTVVGAKDSFLLKRNDTLVGKFKFLKVIDDINLAKSEGTVKIKLNNPDKPFRVYDGGLELSMENNFIRILNLVDIEHYTAGVIQSEVGKMNLLEFDKLKAEIIRTYSLSNLRKHEPENFNLCDQVHCQMYRGKTFVDNINKAVEQTKGLVLVDTSITLVNASFFSNCGGQTCNSEDVWQKALPYLRSVKDTFCHRSLDAYWSKTIPKSDWLNYFEKKYKYPLDDTSAKKQLLSFSQDERKIYFTETPVKIYLKVMRDDWKLKSTFFSVETIGDKVILKGRGFGHGVGLCQEGAMRMAKLGYTSRQIIDFYYQDVTLIDLAKLEFFKEE